MLFGDGGVQRGIPIFFEKNFAKDLGVILSVLHLAQQMTNMKDNTAELRALAARYKMNGTHFHKDGRGFIIVTRAGIEHICRVAKVKVTYTPIYAWSDAEKARYVIQADAVDAAGNTVTTFGEASAQNNRNPYPVAMAEKRAMSRAVLKLTGFYELDAKGEDEMDNTNSNNK